MMADPMHRVKPPKSTAPMVEWAIYCAARFQAPVFPLKPIDHPSPGAGRTPLHHDWQTEATTDPARIARLWAFDPDANVGIHCDGLLVVDVDVKEGKRGDLSWQYLLDQHGIELQDTLTQETPTGGLHLVYRTPDPSRNTQNQLGPDIDTRARGGYIVGAGSVVERGRYVIVHDAPIQDAPLWMTSMVGRRRERTDAARSAMSAIDTPEQIEDAIDYLEGSAPEAVEGQGGDATTYRVACRVRDFGLSEQTAIDLMLDHWNGSKAFPPWDADDIVTKVRNAYQYATSPVGNRVAAAEFDTLESDLDLPLDVRLMGDFVFSGPPPYTIRGLLTSGSVTMLTGNSDAGKSPLMLDMAVAVARGAVWNGMRTRRGAVLHLSTEGRATLEARILAQRIEHGIVPADPLAFGSVNLNLVDGPDTRVVIQTAKALGARFNLPVGLVVIDTMSHVLGGGDESDPVTVRALTKNLQRIATATGAAVVVVHHPPKDESTLYRGHSSLINDIGALIYVEIDEATGVRTVTTPRIKDWQRIQPLRYGIKIVELMKDEQGDPVTSVVVDWDLQRVKDGRCDLPLNGEEQLAVEAIAEIIRDTMEPNRPDSWQRAEITRAEVMARRKIYKDKIGRVLQGLVDRRLLRIETTQGGPKKTTVIYRPCRPLDVWEASLQPNYVSSMSPTAESEFESDTYGMSPDVS